ncbi:hypothetical protein PG993_008901 [Apiospora rasikravindrae]|uniref:Uncharacterized protein n=1 Tax=Apiospora rasikravindrae TaxID=990691 RepID=A0ABR1SPN1_9PEZI
MTFGSLTAGGLTFAKAKTIDIVWDTVVGQGGRLLHGWVLYRYVLHSLLVVLIERFTVTADFYMAVSFSRSSFETLWTLLAFIFRRGSITVLLCTLMVIYALGYTLFFSVIWGAATGYVGLSQNFYPMPNGDVIGLNSRDLSLCWALDGTRIGLSGRVIELGPSFEDVGGLTKALLLDNTTGPRTELCVKETQDVYQTLYYTASGWRQARTTETVWDYFVLRGDATSIRNSSFNFKSIRDYALTAQTLRMAVGKKY